MLSKNDSLKIANSYFYEKYADNFKIINTAFENNGDYIFVILNLCSINMITCKLRVLIDKTSGKIVTSMFYF